MSETAVSVADAARDFLGLLRQIETRHEAAVLLRNGQPIARLIPCAQPAVTCDELADRWAAHARLAAEEAEGFAHDLETARANLPLLPAAWD